MSEELPDNEGIKYILNNYIVDNDVLLEKRLGDTILVNH